MALARFLYPSYLATLIHDASYKYLTSIWIMLEPSQAWNAAWLPTFRHFSIVQRPQKLIRNQESFVGFRKTLVYQEDTCGP